MRVLHDGNLFYELGYSSFQQYCDVEFGLARSTAFEYVRVAEALDRLPNLRVLFGDGDLSWAQVRAIARVATSDSEREWIELAFAETVEVLLAEVREARRKRRDAPRDRRYGLPNLTVRLSIELTIEDRERVRAAFEIVGLGAACRPAAGRRHRPSSTAPARRAARPPWTPPRVRSASRPSGSRSSRRSPIAC